MKNEVQTACKGKGEKTTTTENPTQIGPYGVEIG